ncbi:hypothetical protein [Kingella oralis]|nr:hypothetical protein [Kingella oralis]QMT43540.1 hypothetical protein H3L93_04180 [Kingella oralis]
MNKTDFRLPYYGLGQPEWLVMMGAILTFFTAANLYARAKYCQNTPFF